MMQLRFATAADTAAMLALYTPYVETTTASWEYAPPAQEEFARRIAQHAEEGFPWLCAEENGSLLGYAYAGRYGVRKGYDFSAEVSVYVGRNAQGRGVGRALYTALLALLRAQGCCTAWALITDENTGSGAFHRSMGFAKVARLDDMGYKENRWLALALYRLPLCSEMPAHPGPFCPVMALPQETVAAALRAGEAAATTGATGGESAPAPAQGPWAPPTADQAQAAQHPANATIAALMERRSVRVFEPRGVDAALKAQLLLAAEHAPTAGCQQLYTILDITDPALKEKLAQLCDHQPFIAQAPVVLVFLADCQRWYDAFRAAGCAPRAPGAGDVQLAMADAIIAAQNVVVAAHSFGMGSCYIGDVTEQCAAMRKALCLPPYCVPAAMLVLGWPTQQQKQRPKPPRFPQSLVVHENTYLSANPQEFEAAWQTRERRAGRAEQDYPTRLKAFCDRKYNSSFSREMTRSVEEYLAAFSTQPEDAAPAAPSSPDSPTR